MKRTSRTLLIISSLVLASCSFFDSSADVTSEEEFLSSGTLVLSQRVPSNRELTVEKTTKSAMAPVVGYFPNADKFFPAVNEHWISIDKATKTISLFRGDEKLKDVKAVGKMNLKEGTYSLLHKEKNPLWYAPDKYFARRGIEVPSSDDLGRYRRGAYGDYALFLPNALAIHSSPIWSSEVGGIKVDEKEIKKLYASLSLGSQIIVK